MIDSNHCFMLTASIVDQSRGRDEGFAELPPEVNEPIAGSRLFQVPFPERNVQALVVGRGRQRRRIVARLQRPARRVRPRDRSRIAGRVDSPLVRPVFAMAS